MTDKQTPTDAELKALWQIHAADIGGIFCYARAVLAKWGTPAPVGVGEVAERYRNAIASACEGWTMPDGLRKHLETALWSPPTPQPTHALAGAAPLTPDQIAEIADAAHREYDRLVSSGQCAPRWSAVFAHLLEMHHGIKGGQHGTE